MATGDVRYVLPTKVFNEKTSYDRYSRSVSVINTVHRMTHEGMVFHSSGKVLAVADAGTAEFSFVVPAGAFPHLHRVRMQFGGGDVDLDAYEGTVIGSPIGTPLSSFNLNRNSSNTPALLLYGSPTVVSDGTLIHSQWAPPTANGQGNSVEGVVDVAQGEEWILKPDTTYLFRITNNSGTTIDIGYEIMWYEPTFPENVGEIEA